LHLVVLLWLRGASPQRSGDVFLDLVVEDAQGRPVRNLMPEDVIISQQGVRQRVAKLEAKEPPCASPL
jgi:hypothetical protein